MALRGKKPEAIKKRLKLFLYGPAGVGKTTAACQFPKPYLIDTEKGAENEEYVQLLKKAGGAYYFTCDFDEMLSEVKALLSEKHGYKTVIIDPLTVLYNDLIDQNIKAIAGRKKGMKEDDEEVTAYGRHKGVPDRKIKHLLNLLLRLDMNVVVTSHAKGKWERDGDKIKQVGVTYDCYNKLDYLFDLGIELQKRGNARWGVVTKTRMSKSFVDGDEFEFSYDAVAERYGRDVLEADAKPEALATPEQVAELARLIEVFQQPAEEVDKWLDKAGAADPTELPADAVQKWIDHLRKKIDGKEAA